MKVDRPLFFLYVTEHTGQTVQNADVKRSKTQRLFFAPCIKYCHPITTVPVSVNDPAT